MNLCEIRVPTYRRPAMLRRCLESLIKQTHVNWVAIILDDAPEADGRLIVAEFNDPRLVYRPNQPRLGCCGNLDLAFANEALAGGQYACVLEDDNWLLPGFIEENLEAVMKTGLEIIQRNQLIAIETSGEPPNITEDTTLGGIFGKNDVILTPLQLRGSMFFGCGISNGGLFWKLRAKSSLVVGPTVRHSLMQELCRSLQVLEPIVFAAKPLAVFSLPADRNTSREALGYRGYNRGKQVIFQHLLEHHGEHLVAAATELCKSNRAMKTGMLHAIADSGLLRFTRVLPPSALVVKAWAKGVAKKWLVEDPIREYWNIKGDAMVKSVL